MKFLSSFNTAVLAGLLVSVGSTGVVSAQSAAAPATPAPTLPTWKQKATHGKWDVLCAKADSKDVCQAVQALQTRNETNGNASGQRLLRLSVQKGPQGTVFSFELPFGLDLRPGIVYQIDGGNEAALPFLTCVPSGCVVSTLLTDDFKRQLTSGKQMKVGFRPVGSEKVVVVEVSLEGFSKALAAL